MAYKRKRKKTGDESYTTTTINSDGSKRVTHTHKSGQTTRSSSFSTHRAGVRRTTTYNPGNGGWIKRKSYTGGGRTRRSKSSQGTGLGGIVLLPVLIGLFTMYAFPDSIPYVLGVAVGIAAICLIFTYIAHIVYGGLFILLIYFLMKVYG